MTMNSHPRLSIVVVSWNTRELTHGCLASVLDHAAEVLRMLYRRAYDDPEAMHGAPHHMPIGRPDEVKAARHPVLRWKRA